MKPMHARADDHWTRRSPELIKRGPEAQGAKLTAEEVTDMQAQSDRGIGPATLMVLFGVSRTTVWRHTKGR